MQFDGVVLTLLYYTIRTYSVIKALQVVGKFTRMSVYAQYDNISNCGGENKGEIRRRRAKTPKGFDSIPQRIGWFDKVHL